MLRKIDVGEDKNLFVMDPKVANKPMASFLMDDLPRTAEAALNEARESAWPNWINSEPLVIGHVDDEGKAYMFPISDTIKNKVVLFDIWDYTVLPCRRSLDYLLEWHTRYHAAGLLIVGIHSPRFDFGKDKKNILDACRDYRIQFPVVLDNNFDLWRSLENRYWPRRVLIDAQGKTQFDMSGEGSYVELEKTIQVLLRQLSPGLACPPVMKTLRKIDQDDYAIPVTTSDIYVGMKKNPRLGNAQVFSAAAEEMKFKDDSGGAYAPELLYLNGPWTATKDSIIAGSMKSAEPQLTINFQATDVYIVARTKPKNPADIPQMIKVQVLIDKKPILDEHIGADAMINELRRSVVIVRDPKAHHVVTGLEHKPHELTIKVENDTAADTLELYALFFEHMA